MSFSNSSPPRSRTWEWRELGHSWERNPRSRQGATSVPRHWQAWASRRQDWTNSADMAVITPFGRCRQRKAVEGFDDPKGESRQGAIFHVLCAGLRANPAVEDRPPLVARFCRTHTPELFRTAVLRAAEFLRAGEVVALPTETVYGLAASALDARAVARIFQVKGRPAHNPIIVHVASLDMAQRCVGAGPPSRSRLAKAFWPGPLTLVLPRAKNIPSIITADGMTVGRAVAEPSVHPGSDPRVRFPAGGSQRKPVPIEFHPPPRSMCESPWGTRFG